jgi:predicted phosphodiesterase
MPAGKQKLSEMMLYSLAHGEKETIEQFKLNIETWNRYKRECRKYFGEGLESLVKLKEQFSDDEIKMLATGSRPNPHNTTAHNFTGTNLKIGVMSDNHLGSAYSDPKLTLETIAEFNKQKVDMVVHSGDIVEGMMGRPGDVYELTHIGYKAQRDLAIATLSGVSQPLYMISGNHDYSYNSKHGTGANIVEDICNAIPNAQYLGHDEGDIEINGITIRLFHGGDGSCYALSYRGQKLIEAISGGSKPAIFIAGHSHKSIYMPAYRNVHYIEAGTLQWQSSWMRGKKLAAHVGFWVLDIIVGDGEVKSIKAQWTAFYK